MTQCTQPEAVYSARQLPKGSLLPKGDSVGTLSIPLISAEKIRALKSLERRHEKGSVQCIYADEEKVPGTSSKEYVVRMPSNSCNCGLVFLDMFRNPPIVILFEVAN